MFPWRDLTWRLMQECALNAHGGEWKPCRIHSLGSARQLHIRRFFLRAAFQFLFRSCGMLNWRLVYKPSPSHKPSLVTSLRSQVSQLKQGRFNTHSCQGGRELGDSIQLVSSVYTHCWGTQSCRERNTRMKVNLCASEVITYENLLRGETESNRERRNHCGLG